MGITLSRRAFVTGAVGLAALVSTACASAEQTSAQESAEATSAEAGSAASAAQASGSSAASEGEEPLKTFDMHCDTIDVLGMVGYKPYADFKTKHTGSLVSNDAELSADGMGDAQWVQCFGIWIPPTEGGVATDVKPITWYRDAVSWFSSQMDEHSDVFTQVRDFSEVPAILEEGKLPAVLTVENASCLEEGVDIVDEFVKDGVMIASLTWNGANALGGGVDDSNTGLTDLGRACVTALEDHGIVLDVSHLNDKSFWDLDALASKPYVATHSNARAVCNNARNLTDDQFKALASRGGVVGLNFHNDFVREGKGKFTFDTLARHVEHWLELDGEDVIALGSDRDGASIPEWVAHCSKQQALYDQFVERLGVNIAQKLFYDNAARFFGAS